MGYRRNISREIKVVKSCDTGWKFFFLLPFFKYVYTFTLELILFMETEDIRKLQISY